MLFVKLRRDEGEARRGETRKSSDLIHSLTRSCTFSAGSSDDDVNVTILWKERSSIRPQANGRRLKIFKPFCLESSLSPLSPLLILARVPCPVLN